MTDQSDTASATSPADQTSTVQESPLTAKQKASRDVLHLLVTKSLYSKIEGDEEYIAEVENILDGDTRINYDNYCSECEQTTPWTLQKYVPRNTGGGSGGRYVQDYKPIVRAVSAVCMRRQHFHTYILHVGGSVVQKIGQKPSMADIALGELKTMPGIEKQDRRELGRAIGLFAHDTPLGAFVYLRRVFERMISRAHDRHKERQGEYLSNWKDLRMGERIIALAAELPRVVQENYAVWGLLSKGIHELADDDADVLFPLVKAVIFEMLGEEERQRQASIQMEATRKALASAAARYSTPAGQGG